MPEKAVFKPVVPFNLPRWATNPPATQNALKTAKNGPGGFLCLFSEFARSSSPPRGNTFCVHKSTTCLAKKDAAILTSFFLTFGCAFCGFGAAFPFVPPLLNAPK